MTRPLRSAPAGTAAARLGAWAAGFDAATSAPAGVRGAARRALVDVVGCALAGSRHPTTLAVASHARSQLGDGRCGIVGAAPSGPLAAAMVNATAAHVLDFDDTCFEGVAHISAVVWPAVQAAAETAGATGRELLSAFIAGAEAEAALGRSLGRGLYDRGWWNTALIGAVGAAAGAARALRLDAGRTTAAIALALAFAGGQRSVLGTTAKPAGCGLAARAGLEAALLARSGIEAPADALEEPRGFAALANGGHHDPAGFDGLGTRFALIDPGFAFKAYPACSAAQAAIEATLMLRTAHGLRPDAVAVVRCEVTPLVVASLTFDRPKTPTEAQFSLPYAVARALVDGRFDTASLAPDALADATVRRLMPAIGMTASDTLALSPADLVDHPEAAIVTIDTHDGRHLRQAVPAATGMPANPMPDETLDAKFRANAAPAIGRAAAEALLGRLRGIDGLAEAAGLLTEGEAA